MMKKARDWVKRRFESVDPNPKRVAVPFQRPPTLAEQIARYMHQASKYAESQGYETLDEADDFSEDDDHPSSPHELVYDEDLGREVSQGEKRLLEEQRKRFDAFVRSSRQQRSRTQKRESEANKYVDAERPKPRKKISSDESDE